MAAPVPPRPVAQPPLPPPEQETQASGAGTDRAFHPARVWAAVALNWLLPGVGYLALGDKRRGLALVILLNGMFLLGVKLQGGVILPEFNVKSSTFNVINVLTFTVQLGAGCPSLLSLEAHQATEKGSTSPLIRFLAGEESAATFDLGSFHLLLVGALNYFACCAIYDRHRPRPGLRGGKHPDR